MNAPRFLEVELSFGRHAARYELPRDAPAVIVGPNGSGKTTLVDGLLRTVFGFNRRLADERALAEARRPWDGRPFLSTVRLATDDGELSWSRDHETDEVRVQRDDGSVLFAGVANAAASGAGERTYRELVERLFAVGDLEAYGRTAFVGQGRLLHTGFDASLLRLGAGGHRRWRDACRRIEERHKDLTREPIGPGHRRLNRDRRLESLAAELDERRRELVVARAARESRRDAAERLRGVEEAITALDAELAGLVDWRSYLHERARVDAERADARQRFDRLVDLQADLKRTRDEAAEAERERDRARAASGDAPGDLRRRVDELRAAWRAHDGRVSEVAGLAPAAAASLIGDGTGTRLVVGAAVSTVGLVAWGTGTSWAWVVVLVGAVLASLAVAQARSRAVGRREARDALARAERQRDEAHRRAGEMSRALDAGSPPDFGALAARIEASDRLKAAERQLQAARERHAEVMRRVARVSETEERPGRSLPHLLADAGRRLTAVEERSRELVENAPADLLERELSERAVESRTEEVRSELAARRSERDRLLLDLDRAQREAADAGRLDARVRELATEVDEVEATVDALRRARALLEEGYERYRAHDESRLVDAVASRLEPLGDPPLGPFEAGDGLEEPSVELAGRRVAVDSPHLSHGQAHLVGLAIRLGAADFLAGDGPAPPLLVEDPFVHLDDEHAERVWNLLQQVSVHRQVIVTSREAELLNRLGVRPSVRLRRSASNSASPDRPAGEAMSTTHAEDA